MLVVSKRPWWDNVQTRCKRDFEAGSFWSPLFCGALNSTQTLRGGQTKRRPITKGLAINWRDVVSFGFYSLWFFGSGRDITHLALVFHSLNFLIYIGLRFRLMGFKYQFIAKPRPLHATLDEIFKSLPTARRQVSCDWLCGAVHYLFGWLV